MSLETLFLLLAIALEFLSTLEFSNDSSYSSKKSFDDSDEAINTIESVISSEGCCISESNSLIMNDCTHSDEIKSSIEEKISSKNEAIRNSFKSC